MKKYILAALLLLSIVALVWQLTRPKVYPPEPMHIDAKVLKKAEEIATVRNNNSIPSKGELLIEGMLLSVQSDSLCKAITAIPEGNTMVCVMRIYFTIS